MSCRMLTIHRSAAVVMATLALVSALALQPARAQSVVDDSALGMVPTDTAFFVSSLRNREQFDRFVNSKAFQKIMELPAVQMGVGMLMAQWENPQDPQMAMAKQFLEQPENQQLVEMLKDAVSHEVFVWGDESFADALVFFNRINRANQTAQIQAMTTGGDQEQLMAQKMMELLAEHGDELKIPVMTMGFKLSDTQPAQDQLKRLEMLATMVLQQQPELSDRFQRETIGGGDFLTLRLDGSMVPWDQLRSEIPGSEQQREAMITRFQSMTFALALGVKDDYLILSLGSGTDHLANFGQGQTLASRDEFAALRTMADKPIVSVSYVSESFMERAGDFSAQFNDMMSTLKQALPLAPIPEEMKQSLSDDMDELSTDIAGAVPTPGAVMSFEFMTPAGYESYSYNWSENVALDGTQPLTILNHVGGDPLMFFAARGKNQPENYDLFVKWVKKAFGYAETFAMQEIPEGDREMVMNLKNEMMPLVERFDTATRQLMIPAFADSQGALVIDAKSTSTAWHAFMPVSDRPLPLPEVALVYGVSDAEQAKAAFSEYFAITQDLLTKLHEASTGDYAELFDQEIPLIELPKPLERTEGSGTVYYYTLPQTTGLDPQIAPNAGLSDDVMAMSLLPKFTARLLTETPVTNSGPLADVNRPLAAAGHLDFAGLIDMISPWVDYGMMMAGALQASEGAQPDEMAMVMEHVKVGMEVLRCFRGVSSVTYIENGVSVSHTEWRFQDLP